MTALGFLSIGIKTILLGIHFLYFFLVSSNPQNKFFIDLQCYLMAIENSIKKQLEDFKAKIHAQLMELQDYLTALTRTYKREYVLQQINKQNIFRLRGNVIKSIAKTMRILVESNSPRPLKLPTILEY